MLRAILTSVEELFNDNIRKGVIGQVRTIANVGINPNFMSGV